MREHAADVASTGNHGQSIAYAAGPHGLRAVVFVPEGANPDKIASMRRLGAEVREQGARFAEANAAALEFAAEHAMRFVAVDEPLLLPGVATAALEVLDPHEGQQPDTELVIVPLGGGSGACGWVLTREGLGSACEVWAVQSAQAPAGHDSWREGRIVERPDATMAEGMATGTGFEVTQDRSCVTAWTTSCSSRIRRSGRPSSSCWSRRTCSSSRRERRRWRPRSRRAIGCAAAASCWC